MNDVSNKPSNEQVVWEEYLKMCKSQGRTPSPQDFAKWARTLLTAL